MLVHDMENAVRLALEKCQCNDEIQWYEAAEEALEGELEGVRMRLQELREELDERADN